MRIRTIRYFFDEGIKGIRRNVSFASLGVVAGALIIFGSFLALMMNVNELCNYFDSLLKVSVFLKDDITPAQRDALAASLKRLDGVTKVTYVSKETALQRAKEWWQDKRGLLDTFGPDTFPASFDISVKRASMVRKVADAAAKMDGVSDVEAGDEANIERLARLLKAVRIFMVILLIGLAAATVLIIGNTIRLTVSARRREIEIMRLVGATDWYIRGPFMVEGMALGLMGAAVSAVLVVSLYYFGARWTSSALPFVPVVTGREAALRIVMSLGVTGLVVGALGSWYALRKHLAAHAS